MLARFEQIKSIRPQGVLAGRESGLVGDGLVMHYKFDTGTGQVLSDHSGLAKHGTLTNAPTWTGKGLTFVRTSSHYVDCGNPAITVNTIQMVYYNDVVLNSSTTLQCPLAFRDDPACIYCGNFTGTFTNEIIAVGNNVAGAGNCAWTGTDNVPVGWHLIEFRWNNSKYEIIIDKIYKPITTNGTPQIITANKFYIGRNVDGRYINGRFAYLLVYNTSLSESQMEQNRIYLKKDLWKRGINFNI